MHGIIFQQLQQFVIKNYGTSQWLALTEAVGLKGKVYFPNQVYPDQEVVNLVIKAGEATSQPPSIILEAFGEFIAPSLLKIYSASINSNWSVLDLLENVEKTIHKAVRFADKGATPPELNCTRLSNNEIEIKYSSKRKLVEVGIGIINAIAKIKNESVEIKRTDTLEGTALYIKKIK